MHSLLLLLVILGPLACVDVQTEKTAPVVATETQNPKLGTTVEAQSNIPGLSKDVSLPTKAALPSDQLVSFDVITTFEGNIDPKNPPKIKI